MELLRFTENRILISFEVKLNHFHINSLIEKTITLDNVTLVDFLGLDNKTINELSSAFPKSRIVSRGNEILIKGESSDIVQISDILNALIDHFHQFGRITEENVRGYISQEKQEGIPDDADGVLLFGTKGNPIKVKTPNQQRLVQSVKDNDLVFALGPAGTGKTYISVAMAVRALKNKQVKKIIITRPAVEAGENLGFLPGDLKEKIDPYLRPIYDALGDMVAFEKLKYYMEREIIEIPQMPDAENLALHFAQAHAQGHVEALEDYFSHLIGIMSRGQQNGGQRSAVFLRVVT